MVSFAESLQDDEGNPLVRSTRIASSIPLPQDVPDLVVATPAGLMNATTDLGPYAGWEWTKAGIVSRYVLLRAGQSSRTQDVAFDRLHVCLHDAPCDSQHGRCVADENPQRGGAAAT